MELPQRKLPRLREFDYSTENYYFVTICTKNKKCIFGEPKELNELGRLAENELQGISEHYDGVRVDKYVIMPNHIHAVIIIGCDGAERSRPFPTLSTVVGLYKSGTARKIHEKYPKLEIWQKSFFDTVIRNDKVYSEISKYIDENPLKWQLNENGEYPMGMVNINDKFTVGNGLDRSDIDRQHKKTQVYRHS